MAINNNLLTFRHSSKASSTYHDNPHDKSFASDKPIIVSGGDHCGTTWLGKMLSLAKRVGYIHEPFNPNLRWGTSWVETKYWYETYSEHDTGPVNEYIRTLNYDFNWAKAFKSMTTWKDPIHMILQWYMNKVHKFFRRRPLVKDPLCLMSIPWLVNNFDMNVVIIIRHPAGFVSSRLKHKYSFPFSHFLNQSKLMEGIPTEYRDLIKKEAEHPSDLLTQNCLLWNIIHTVIYNYMEKFPYLFVRYEDIAMNPINEFYRLYSNLGLHWNSNISSKIKNFCTRNSGGRVVRESRGQALIFRERLTGEQLERIKDNTKKTYPVFYQEKGWW